MTYKVTTIRMSGNEYRGEDTKNSVVVEGIQDPVLGNFLASAVEGLSQSMGYDDEYNGIVFTIKRGINLDELTLDINHSLTKYQERHLQSGFIDYKNVEKALKKLRPVDEQVVSEMAHLISELKALAVKNSWGDAIHLDDLAAVVGNHPVKQQ